MRQDTNEVVVEERPLTTVPPKPVQLCMSVGQQEITLAPDPQARVLALKEARDVLSRQGGGWRFDELVALADWILSGALPTPGMSPEF